MKLRYNLTVLLSVLVLLIACPRQVMAQTGEITVSGKILDENGEPVVGAFVFIPGTTKGATADLDGAYTITVPSDATLEFSCVGYRKLTEKVSGRNVLNIVLNTDNTSLEESVVVGYGIQKRRDIVGAVESITTDDMQERMGSSMSISRALQGAVPGLTMTFSDGKPNRGATVRIRGAENSIGSGGSALVLVDGVEADMSTVNPDDIASVTVLKDASSAAVYGARGTFGVFLLTTKTPSKGQAKISYNGTFSVYKRTVTPQIVTNGYDFTTTFLESYINAKGTDPANINNVFKFSRTWYKELEKRNSDPSYEKWAINNKGAYE